MPLRPPHWSVCRRPRHAGGIANPKNYRNESQRHNPKSPRHCWVCWALCCCFLACLLGSSLWLKPLLMGETLTGTLRKMRWQTVLYDTVVLTGALMGLLVGAPPAISLVFRLLGTDRWLTELLRTSPWPRWATAAAVLLGDAQHKRPYCCRCCS
jgi:hypothetical protein